jgi:hypothetical protein
MLGPTNVVFGYYKTKGVGASTKVGWWNNSQTPEFRGFLSSVFIVDLDDCKNE